MAVVPQRRWPVAKSHTSTATRTWATLGIESVTSVMIRALTARGLHHQALHRARLYCLDRATLTHIKVRNSTPHFQLHSGH